MQPDLGEIREQMAGACATKVQLEKQADKLSTPVAEKFEKSWRAGEWPDHQRDQAYALFLIDEMVRKPEARVSTRDMETINSDGQTGRHDQRVRISMGKNKAATQAYIIEEGKRVPLHVLIDTGADRSVMSGKFLREKCPKTWANNLRPQHEALSTVTGKPLEIEGIVDVDLVFHSEDGRMASLMMTATVIPYATKDLVIGYEALKANGATIDMGDMTVSLKQYSEQYRTLGAVTKVPTLQPGIAVLTGVCAETEGEDTLCVEYAEGTRYPPESSFMQVLRLTPKSLEAAKLRDGWPRNLCVEGSTGASGAKGLVMMTTVIRLTRPTESFKVAMRNGSPTTSISVKEGEAAGSARDLLGVEGATPKTCSIIENLGSVSDKVGPNERLELNMIALAEVCSDELEKLNEAELRTPVLNRGRRSIFQDIKDMHAKTKRHARRREQPNAKAEDLRHGAPGEGASVAPNLRKRATQPKANASSSSKPEERVMRRDWLIEEEYHRVLSVTKSRTGNGKSTKRADNTNKVRAKSKNEKRHRGEDRATKSGIGDEALWETERSQQEIEVSSSTIRTETRRKHETTTTAKKARPDSVASVQAEELGATPAETLSAEEIETKFGVKLNESKELDDAQRDELRVLLSRYPEVWNTRGKVPVSSSIAEITLPLTRYAPKKQRPYKIKPELIPHVRKELEEMYEGGMIEPSISPWGSPLIAVQKKGHSLDDPKVKVAIDFRYVNQLTIPHAGSIGTIEEIWPRIAHAEYFSALDASYGYASMSIERASRPQTAFVLPPNIQLSNGPGERPELMPHRILGNLEERRSFPGGSLWQFRRGMYGLCNLPSSYSTMVGFVTQGLSDIACTFIDDILVFTKTWEQHVKALEMVFRRLALANITLSGKKAALGRKSVMYLGNTICAKGMIADAVKVREIVNYPRPTSWAEVRSWLGKVSYLRLFWANVARLLEPIFAAQRYTAEDKIKAAAERAAIIKKGGRVGRFKKDFVWTKAMELAFLQTKQVCSRPPILAFPDLRLPLCLYTDASLVAAGAILIQWQRHEGELRPHILGTYSAVFKVEAERNYHIAELETLAIVLALRRWRWEVECCPHTTIFCDNATCRTLFSKIHENKRIANWAIGIAELAPRCTIVAKAGCDNPSDCLSRLPLCEGYDKSMVTDLLTEADVDLNSPNRHFDVFVPAPPTDEPAVIGKTWAEPQIPQWQLGELDSSEMVTDTSPRQPKPISNELKFHAQINSIQGGGAGEAWQTSGGGGTPLIGVPVTGLPNKNRDRVKLCAEENFSEDRSKAERILSHWDRYGRIWEATTGRKFRVVDLFCGEGGSSYGAWLAGAEVHGVDNNHNDQFPKERGMKFHLGDATDLTFLQAKFPQVDAVISSPPCQRYSTLVSLGQTESRADALVPLSIKILEDWSATPNGPKIYACENVVGSTRILNKSYRPKLWLLCGTQFGLHVFRHRLFRLSPGFSLDYDSLRCNHYGKVVGENGRLPPVNGIRSKPGAEINKLTCNMAGVYGKRGRLEDWQTAMGAKEGHFTKKGIATALPYSYTRFVVGQMIAKALHDQFGIKVITYTDVRADPLAGDVMDQWEKRGVLNCGFSSPTLVCLKEKEAKSDRLIGAIGIEDDPAISDVDSSENRSEECDTDSSESKSEEQPMQDGKDGEDEGAPSAGGLGDHAVLEVNEAAGWLPIAEEEIARRQNEDEFLASIKTYLLTGDLPAEPALARRISHEGNSCWQIVNNTVYRIGRRSPQSRIEFRLAVPSTMARQLIIQFHNNPLLGAHAGVHIMHSKLSAAFWIENLRSEIQGVCRTCDLCQRMKAKEKANNEILSLPNRTCRPFAGFYIDLKGPCRTTSAGYRWILIASCMLTRFCFAIPLRGIKSTDVARALINKIFSVVGYPNLIMSDRGRNLTGGVVRELREVMGIRGIQTTAYNPSGNSIVETRVKRVGMLLGILVAQNDDDWPELLPHITYAVNSSETTATGMSPYFMVFGTDPSSGLITQPKDIGDEDPVDLTEWLATHVRTLRQAWLRALEIGRDQQVRYLTLNNRGRKGRHTFRVGDLVLLPPSVAGKVGIPAMSGLKQTGPIQRRGPFRVVAILDNDLAELDMPEADGRLSSRIFRFNRLTPYYPELLKHLAQTRALGESSGDEDREQPMESEGMRDGDERGLDERAQEGNLLATTFQSTSPTKVPQNVNEPGSLADDDVGGREGNENDGGSGSDAEDEGRRRWEVDELIAVEQRGRGRRLHLYVKWGGYNPKSGEPWENTWVNIADVTVDLRRETRRMEKAKYAKGSTGMTRVEEGAQTRSQAQKTTEMLRGLNESQESIQTRSRTRGGLILGARTNYTAV